MIPPHLRPLFWDINTDLFDPLAYPDYTIFRVLELGEPNDVAWLRQTFSEPEITAVIRGERRMSRRSAGFWAMVYHIPPDQVAALEQPPTPWSGIRWR